MRISASFRLFLCNLLGLAREGRQRNSLEALLVGVSAVLCVVAVILLCWGVLLALSDNYRGLLIGAVVLVISAGLRLLAMLAK